MTDIDPRAVDAVEDALIRHSVENRHAEACSHQAGIAVDASAPIVTRAAYDAVIARISLGTPYMTDRKYVAGAQWVRSQIEDVLIPELEKS